jgi:ribonucleoside-diphosphate reductase alpha chain
MGPKLQISEELHALKYRGIGESFEEAMVRVAGAVCDDDQHFHKLKNILCDMRFLPAGRVQAAMGSPRQVTPYNCMVSQNIEDSMEGIMDAATNAAHTMRMGGGIGYSFSTLRPRGSHIASLDSKSSGAVSFMGIFDAVCKTIASAGHRRGAQMGVLRVDHPDIEEFIRAKQISGNLEAFNISVAITDDFMRAVEQDQPFNLSFKGRVYRTISARNLWEEIMRSNWEWAEPGVLFIDQINRTNNLYYCEEIVATNPCVSGDTPILTSDGYQAIKSLVGKKVKVWNGVEWSEVEPKITGHNQEMVVVEFSDGNSLCCTRYHKFVLSDGSRVEAQYLVEEDKLLKHGWPTIYSGEDYPEAYQQGFYAGDGWSTGNRNYIGLYGEKKKLAELFQYQSKHEYAITGGYEGTNTDETKIYLYLGREVMRSKRFVPGVGWSVKSRLEWLSGLIDSDGCAVKHNTEICGVSIQISSKDREFMLKVKHMLNTLGVQGTVNPMNDNWRLSISPTSTQHLQEIGLYTHRVNLADNEPSRNASRFVKVLNVTADGVCKKVYCFSEPKENKGIFGGVLTSQCGEQPLPPSGACLLGSFNLTAYIKTDSSNKHHFDWGQFENDIPVVVRAMDNIVDRAVYPLEQQQVEAHSKRRMGLGVTGLANAGEILAKPYGSGKFIYFENAVLRELKNAAYKSSIQLSKEKGPFPLFDKDRYLEGEFVKGLDEDIRKGIKRHGIRNSHLLSVAPTGTISLTANNISSGLEPVFAYEYDRAINTPGGIRTETVTDFAFREYQVEGKTSTQLTADDHLKVLLTAQKHVDSAISKTCNVNPEMPWDEFKEIYMLAWKGGAKGLTTFNPGGSRKGVLNASPQTDENEACWINPDGSRSCE